MVMDYRTIKKIKFDLEEKEEVGLTSTWKTSSGVYVVFNFEGLEPVNRRKLRKMKKKESQVYVGFQLKSGNNIIRNFNSLGLITLLGLEDYIVTALRNNEKVFQLNKLGGNISEERIQDRFDKRKMETYFQLIKVSEDNYTLVVGDNQYKGCGLFKTVEYDINDLSEEDLINLVKVLKYFNYNKELNVGEDVLVN